MLTLEIETVVTECDRIVGQFPALEIVDTDHVLAQDATAFADSELRGQVHPEPLRPERRRMLLVRASIMSAVRINQGKALARLLGCAPQEQE